LFLDYNKINNTIHKIWIKQINYNPYINRRVVVYTMTYLIKKQITVKLKSQRKWERELNIHFDTSADTSKHAHKFTNKITIDTNLSYFQYKILHRILTTNIYLTIIGFKDSEL
jgi:hypothetical protein